MPFTLAHPALVIPLSKSRYPLSLTGLIIGSMTPDVEFFIQMREVENIGHQWYGILFFDLPLAICLSFLFHNLFRNSFLDNLPNPYRRRFISSRTFNWNQYFIKNKFTVLLSIIIGLMSHLIWDGFTHHDGFAVEWITLLSQDIIIANTALPIYFALQVLFSIAGMIVVHFQIMQMPTEIENTDHCNVDLRYWIIFISLISGILFMRLCIWPEYNSFGGIMIAGMGSILYSWPIVSFIFHNKLSLLKLKS